MSIGHDYQCEWKSSNSLQESHEISGRSVLSSIEIWEYFFFNTRKVLTISWNMNALFTRNSSQELSRDILCGKNSRLEMSWQGQDTPQSIRKDDINWVSFHFSVSFSLAVMIFWYFCIYVPCTSILFSLSDQFVIVIQYSCLSFLLVHFFSDTFYFYLYSSFIDGIYILIRWFYQLVSQWKCLLHKEYDDYKIYFHWRKNREDRSVTWKGKDSKHINTTPTMVENLW